MTDYRSLDASLDVSRASGQFVVPTRAFAFIIGSLDRRANPVTYVLYIEYYSILDFINQEGKSVNKNCESG